MSLFKRFSGSGENIATETLCYFLSSEDRFRSFRNSFFNRIFEGLPESDYSHPEMRTQGKFRSGTPDLMIIADKSFIILENKLGAFLSGDDQLVRYAKVFDNANAVKEYFPLFDVEKAKIKILVFLAPRKSIELSYSATEKISKKENEQSFPDVLRQKGIKLVTLPWEDVLGYLDPADSLQNELILLVKDYLNLELTSGEKMILEDPQIPSAINKLVKDIDMLANEVSAHKWRNGKMSQSIYLYGFPIKAKKLGLWFGYFLQLWEKHQTPIFLQIRESWIEEENRDEIKEKLKRYSFEYDKEAEYIRPFKIDSRNSWKDELFNILRAFIGESKD